MRTLTKEWVNSSGLFKDSGVLSTNLIMDGPKEVICRELNNFQKIKKEAAALAKQKNMLVVEQNKKRDYAKRFISRFIKMHGISRENMKDLVRNLENEDILLLENTILERLRKPVFLQVVGSFSVIAIFIGSSLAAFLFGNQAMIVFTALLFFSTLGWLLPFMLLTEFFHGSSNNGEYGANIAMGYIGSQKVFKNKYGPQYFPYQEVREELEKY